jgi:hypothetical protein
MKLYLSRIGLGRFQRLSAWFLIGLLGSLALRGRAHADPAGTFADPVLEAGPSWTWSGNRFTWFKWTAPDDGAVGISCYWLGSQLGIIDPIPQKPNFGVFVYNDASKTSSLVKLAGPTYSRTYNSGSSFVAVKGTTYQLSLANAGNGGWDNPNGYPYQVRLFQPALTVPANDDLANAKQIFTTDSPIIFDLSYATVQPGEPKFGTWYSACFQYSGSGLAYSWYGGSTPFRGGNSIWFLWKATSSGHLIADVTLPCSFPEVAVFRLADGVESNLTWTNLIPVARTLNGQTGAGDRFPQVSSDMRIRIGAGFQANIGETYVFQVDQLSPASDTAYNGTFRPPICWEAQRNHSFGHFVLSTNTGNDDFNQASILTIDTGYGVFPSTSNIAPSMEPGEPPLSGVSGSLWWRWTATKDDTIAVANSTGIFIGDRVDRLTPISLSPPDPKAWFAFPRLRVVAGTTYSFRTTVDFNYGSWLGLIPTARNDLLANADEFPWGLQYLDAPPGIATEDPGEPPLLNPHYTGGVWFRWTPQRPGRYGFFAPTERVFVGDQLDQLIPVGIRNEYRAGDYEIDLDTAAGIEYKLFLEKGPDGYPTRVALEGFALNDDFAQAQELKATGSLIVNPVFATAEPSEPAHHGVPALASVWYKYTPTVASHVSVFIAGAGSPRIALYQGDSLLNLIRVDSSVVPGSGYQGTMVSFDAVAGQTNYIAVEPGSLDAERNGAAPGFSLAWGPARSNDFIGRWSPIFSTSRTGTTLAANSDDFDRALSGLSNVASVWFHGVANSNGLFAVKLVSNDGFGRKFPARMNVFRGSVTNHLSLSGKSAPLSSQVPAVCVVPLIRNEVIWVQVYTELDRPDLFDIELSGVTRPTAAAPIQFDLTGDPWNPRLLGPDGQFVRIEQSTDLKNWTNFGDALISSDSTRIDLRAPPSVGIRYLRAKTW